ncbi:hypothetical protein FH972_022863 [Carpinus fangiana]|uniref:MRH domain-containing protein n=1 Tax=Carpinus fangiana TaxID=176857 RepID=A0A5N6KU55_9ROSI|nr:hypothetical protein FH972_022863 [Carpinus fangiana]
MSCVALASSTADILDHSMNRSEPVLRGKRLLLNYTDGSPCPSSSSRDRRTILPSTTESYRGRALDDDDGKGDDKDDDGRKGSDSTRRKTSIISLTCDRDPTKPPAVVSFIASPDDCTYIFDVHTIAACATINVQKQTLGPSGVFGVIAIIAILVYIIGGVVYQRVVMHQRGWRQLPNYALWASMTSFVKDMVVIIGASFMRCMPGGRSNRRWLGGSRPTTNGYSGLNGSAAEHGNGSTGSGRGGRGRSGSDDENRLIDQLDEEWDD